MGQWRWPCTWILIWNRSRGVSERLHTITYISPLSFRGWGFLFVDGEEWTSSNWCGGQFVPHTEFYSESRCRSCLMYCLTSLLSVSASITSATQKYHFSCTSSHTVLICRWSNSFNSCIVILPIQYMYPIPSRQHLRRKNSACEGYANLR